MEEEFYRGRIEHQYDLHVLIPDAADRAVVHRVIYEELVVGEAKPASRTEFRKIIQALVEQGAEGVILGCTEIGLLVKESDSPVPLFDTTRLHALAAVEFALKDSP